MAISPLNFFKILNNNGVDFLYRRTDSLLKEFCLCVDDKASKKKHIITANEGNAIALAAGYHLASKKFL